MGSKASSTTNTRRPLQVHPKRHPRHWNAPLTRAKCRPSQSKKEGESDADINIWYPPGKMQHFSLKNDMQHYNVDYTPFEGRILKQWPRYTLLRGKVVWNKENGGILGEKGYGKFVKREVSSSKMAPLGSHECSFMYIHSEPCLYNRIDKFSHANKMS
ncbi:hypothetical protein CC80DRAFT_589737, partial [Byssothecium circinans]